MFKFENFNLIYSLNIYNSNLEMRKCWMGFSHLQNHLEVLNSAQCVISFGFEALTLYSCLGIKTFLTFEEVALISWTPETIISPVFHWR